MNRGQQRYVYFLRPVGAVGPIKIGCSIYPPSRINALSMWSPVPLEIVAMGPGSIRLESFLHRKFKAQRLHSEWFAPSPELLDGIAAVAAGGAVDAVFGAVRVEKPASYEPANHVSVARPHPTPTKQTEGAA